MADNKINDKFTIHSYRFTLVPATSYSEIITPLSLSLSLPPSLPPSLTHTHTDIAQSTPVQLLLKLGARVQWTERGLTPNPEWNQDFTL